jgi:hypothetical protein
LSACKHITRFRTQLIGFFWKNSHLLRIHGHSINIIAFLLAYLVTTVLKARNFSGQVS